jgi:hypothetical protein
LRETATKAMQEEPNAQWWTLKLTIKLGLDRSVLDGGGLTFVGDVSIRADL